MLHGYFIGYVLETLACKCPTLPYPPLPLPPPHYHYPPTTIPHTIVIPLLPYPTLSLYPPTTIPHTIIIPLLPYPHYHTPTTIIPLLPYPPLPLSPQVNAPPPPQSSTSRLDCLYSRPHSVLRLVLTRIVTAPPYGCLWPGVCLRSRWWLWVTSPSLCTPATLMILVSLS